LNAVITAGGRIDGEYAHIAGTTVKALAPVRGVTMLNRAIAAAREAGATRVAVVGGDAVRSACEDAVDRVVDESESGAENLRRALRAWPDNEALLYLTSDLPYIGGACLRAFLNRVPDGAIAMAVAESDAYAKRFPDAPPFGISLGGLRIVNGGAFALPPGAAPRVEDVAMRFFDARKSNAAMARLLGPALLLRFAFRRLTIAALENHAHRMLGIETRALRECGPELCFDADNVADYNYACQHD
jgi:CTP:molybdopterin cytidylyltransferase MocA